MRVLSRQDYLDGVMVPIEDAIEDALFDVFKRLAEHHGFDVPADDDELARRKYGIDPSLEQRRFDMFHAYYWDGYAGEFRDKAIELFEWLGMDVKPDGN